MIKKSVLITESQIKKRVKELGKRLSLDYAGKQVVAVCVLKGAVLFFADLVREMDLPLTLDFMSLSSYKGDVSSKEIIVKKDISVNIMDKHLLIIDDIIDTGYTFQFAKHYLEARQPASVKFVTLLDKPQRREVPIEADYTCFTIDNHFVVGYGLDYMEEFRSLKEIYKLEL